MEKCPIDHEAMRKLWAENSPILNELNEAFQPMGEAVMTEAQRLAEMDNRFDIVTARTGHVPVYEDLPYGLEYVLPLTLFGSLDKIDTPVIPDTDEECQRLANEHRKGAISPFAFADGNYRYIIVNPDDPDSYVDLLKYLRDRSTTIDPDKWSVLKGIARQQADRGTYSIESFFNFRRNNVARALQSDRRDFFDEAATGRFKTYLYSQVYAPIIGSTFNPTDNLMIPVGEYGNEFAERLMRTTQCLIGATPEATRGIATDLSKRYHNVIEMHTGRGRENRSDTAKAMVITTQEGIMSVMQVVALLTAEKVEGYDNPYELTNDILSSGIVEQLTKIVPMGTIGPLNLGGMYFPGLLENKNGLSLNYQQKERIKRAKYKQSAQAVGKWATFYKQKAANSSTLVVPDRLGLMCPAAMPHGALSYIRQGMAELFSQPKKFV